MKLPEVWRYRLQHHRAYWHSRAVGARVLFQLKAGLFRVGGWFRTTREVTAIFCQLGRLVAFSGITAVALLALLATVEWSVLHLAQATSLLDGPAAWLRAVATLANFQTIDSILLALLQVSAVFLGLYFTAVSVVASTAYSRVQADIRDLLTRERVGNAYLKLILLVGTLSLLILAASAIGHSPGILASTLTVILGVVALLSFIPLGNRVFRFFDPTSLVELYIAPEIADSIKRASPQGFAWKDPSFQAHYQREAESRLETYASIVRFAVTREHLRERSLVRLASQSLYLLGVYSKIKPTIPQDSLWFKRAIRYKDWFRADAHTADLAIRGSVSLMQDTIPDPMWFENRIFAIARLSFNTFLSNKDYRSVVTLSEIMRNANAAQTKNFDAAGALHLCSQYQQMILEHLTTFSHDPWPSNATQDQQYMLSCADYHGLVVATIAVEYANALRNVGDFDVRALAASAVERGGRQKARSGAPAEVIAEVARIEEKLLLERAVERRCISPKWYVAQLLALGAARSVKAATEAIVELSVASYLNERETIQRLSPLVAAQVAQRGFEVHSKGETLLQVAESCVARLALYRRIGDIPWEDIDGDALRGRLEQLYDCLLGIISSLAPKLASLPRTGEVPDYFGEIYWRLADDCADALYSSKSERFGRLLPVYFLTTQTAAQRVLFSQESNLEYLTTYAADLTIDLLEISGLALLYSELRGGLEWSSCKALWDRYLAKAESAEGLVKAVVAAVNLRSSQLFMLSPRDMVRGRWEQGLMDVLRRNGLVREAVGPRATRGRRHASPIVRAFGSYGSGFVRPHDVFVAVYIGARPESQGLDLGTRAKDFERSLKRESQAETANHDATEPESDAPFI